MVYGAFHSAWNGTQISVTITTHPLVSLISILYFVGIGSGLLSNAWSAIVAGRDIGLLIGPVALLLFLPYLMIIWTFNFEAAKAIRFLNDVYAKWPQ
jgi:hypothetical protein